MDVRDAEKISTLARSLKTSGLVHSLQEALQKAEEIVLGKKKDQSEQSEEQHLQEIFPQNSPPAEQQEAAKEIPLDDELFSKPEPDSQEAEEHDVPDRGLIDDKLFEDICKELDEDMIRSNEELQKLNRIKQQEKEQAVLPDAQPPSTSPVVSEPSSDPKTVNSDSLLQQQ